VSFSALILCVVIGQSQPTAAIALLSPVRSISLLERGVEKGYFFIPEKYSLKIAVYGPGTLKADVRKVILPWNKDSLAPVSLILYVDNHPIKKFHIVPQESIAASFLNVGSVTPSDATIIEISVPVGKHTYIFYFPQPCPGGAAIHFPEREIVSDKELDRRQSIGSETSLKEGGSQKSYIERFAVEEEKKHERNYGLGLRLGYIVGTDYISTMFFGGDLSFILPILRRSLSLFLEGGYYSQDKKESFNGTPLSWTLQVIPVTLNARCTYPFPSSILPYAGAGAGYFISSMEYGLDGGSKVTKNGSAPGIQAFIGAEVNARVGEAFIEARIFSSNFTNKDADINGGVGQYSINLGWRFLY